MPLRPVRILLSFVWVLLPLAAAADDLLSIYRLAQQSDPQLRAAEAAHAAALEAVPQARAVLLPDISLGSTISRDRFHNRKPEPGEPENSYATNRDYTAQLRQSVYSRERFVQLAQADSRVAQADAEWYAAQQDLITRAATNYFLVLGAQDNLDFVIADKEAIGRTLEQAKQRFEVGLTAITDVYEAQARYDQSVSDEINARKLLADAKEALRELTGEIPYGLEILSEEIPLQMPEPVDQEQWASTAAKQNPRLLAARAATEVARQEIQVQRSGHYPTVDFTADYSRRNNDFGGLGIPLNRNDSGIGLEFNLPLYQGGLVSSQTRQARDLFTQAQEEQTQTQREVERNARDSYRGMVADISKVQALRQAVLSGEKALEASQAGFEVGTRTIVDVLDSQRDLLSSRRDHARSRYDYLLDTLRLKQAAGIVDEADLEQINQLLEPAPANAREAAP
jgi:outer membrane protein